MRLLPFLSLFVKKNIHIKVLIVSLGLFCVALIYPPSFSSYWLFFESSRPSLTTIATIFGNENVEQPVIVSLLASNTMERIKYVDQSGILPYFGYAPTFRRYDHCVGVWALLKRFRCSLKEQVAGLLHDASHTAFSHVADYLFARAKKRAQHIKDNSYVESAHSYQDSVHLDFLHTMQVGEILKEFHITLEEIDPDNGLHKALEQPLPDLCADRIEYNLHTGILWHKLSAKAAAKILKDLRFESDRWFFVNAQSARQLADLSLHFTRHLWGSEWNMVLYFYTTQMLERALELGIIDLKTIQYGMDKEVFAILEKSSAPYIQRRFEACQKISQSFRIIPPQSPEPYDMFFKPKFRGVDPWVQKSGKFYRLSELDPEFAKASQKVKDFCQKGFKVVLAIK